MKKLLYVALICCTAQESLGIDWNLRRFVPAEKVTKRCHQEPRAWLWFNKSDVEKACNCLDADLDIIRQARDVALEANAASLEPNVEIINKFLTESSSKMMDEQQVRTAINTIFSYESAEAREEEVRRFIAARANRMLDFFEGGARSRNSAMLKHSRLNLVEAAAKYKTVAIEDGAKTDAVLIKDWMENGRTEAQCREMITTMYQMYPELRNK